MRLNHHKLSPHIVMSTNMLTELINQLTYLAGTVVRQQPRRQKVVTVYPFVKMGENVSKLLGFEPKVLLRSCAKPLNHEHVHA